MQRTKKRVRRRQSLESNCVCVRMHGIHPPTKAEERDDDDEREQREGRPHKLEFVEGELLCTCGFKRRQIYSVLYTTYKRRPHNPHVRLSPFHKPLTYLV